MVCGGVWWCVVVCSCVGGVSRKGDYEYLVVDGLYINTAYFFYIFDIYRER